MFHRKEIMSVARFGGMSLAVLALLVGGCNTHPVSQNDKQGSVEYQEKFSVGSSEKIDMLWVVDNSGSMCQEQKVLRDNFALFIEELNKTNLDFHIGLTTTDMNPSYTLEPVANPGLLQATPQPVPGFDESCQLAIDPDTGATIAGDYSPIREAIAAAVACTTSQDGSAFSWSNAEIECALRGLPQGCAIAGAGCGGGDTACQPEDLFPAASAYRNIPKVLRSDDYKTSTGALDVTRLTDDFSCSSLVGTRGYGIETGLVAAVEAVSPSNTGGPIDGIDGVDTVDGSAPNHGLIRKDARFALIFVTDENDCSHEGARNLPDYVDAARPELNLSSSCGGDICEIENKEGAANSALIPVGDLKDQFMNNLALSKGKIYGDNFKDAEVLVASIHGKSQRYDGVVPTEDDCSNGSFSAIPPTCATTLGIARSGDRYDRFLREFPKDNFYPPEAVDNPDAALFGWMCTGDFGPALQAIGEFFGSGGAGCINRPVLPCEGPADTSCPSIPYTGEAGTCTLVPNSDTGSGEAKYYCDSGIQLRARVVDPTVDAIAVLEETGYCVEGSIGDRTFPDGCVISTTKYSIDPCPSGLPGVKFLWADEIEAQRVMAGMEIQLRYNSLTSETAGLQ